MKQKIVLEARSWLNTAFCHQGRIKKAFNDDGACDCLGLIIEVSKSLHLKTKHGQLFYLLDRPNYLHIPDGKALKAELDNHLKIIDIPEAGDLVLLSFLGQPQHISFVGNLSVNFSSEKDSEDFISNTAPNSNLTLIHAYMPCGKVCEHIFDQKWRRRAVAYYRFYF